MTIHTVHMCPRSPYEPLFSDRYIMWLAGTYAASGSRVITQTRPVTPREGELLLTNFNRVQNSGEGAILRVDSPSDKYFRLMRPLGKAWAASGLFNSRIERRAPVQNLLSLLRRPFTARSDIRRGRIEAPEADCAIPPGRRLVFRVNVDWDSRGLENLDRWCSRFNLRPTLAVAGSEISGKEKLVRQVVERHGIDIAGHTWSHRVVLPSRSRRTQMDEITHNKAYLENLFGFEVSGFAAPYMKYDRTTFDCLAESGHRWFIRSWSVHPLPLPGFEMLDLGVSFFFPQGWETALAVRLALSDIVVQLHLHDLSRFEQSLETVLADLSARGVRFVNCTQFYSETKAGGRV